MIITSRALGLIQSVISVLCVQNLSINTEICYKILAYSKLVQSAFIHCYSQYLQPVISKTGN